MSGVVLGAREAMVNSLSPHRIYTLMVKAHICQRILQALVEVLAFVFRVLTSLTDYISASCWQGDPSLCHGGGWHPKFIPRALILCPD